MPNIDKSKFRFRIGDKILYNGKKCKILAYYFMIGFNNYRNAYGYTIKIESGGHNGSCYSYDENGNHLSFNERNCWFVPEKWVEPIKKIKKIKKIKIKIK